MNKNGNVSLQRVIIANNSVIGSGSSMDDPVRQITQIFKPNGEHIVTIDPCQKCPHCGKQLEGEQK